MTTIATIDNCCGCRACEQVCPKNCISMVKDNEGFSIPRIDEAECINCGLCYKSCAQTGYKGLHSVRKTYAALHRNHDIVMKSTSGGGMTSIAEIILSEGGVVYGTYLDTEDWKVKFREVENIDEINLVRGSKYVQSDTGDSYTRIKHHLQIGRKVLFVGVPCQVAGLYSYLGNTDLENLYTIDILCHGTPSPDLFINHVKYLEKKYRRKLTGFSFRDKTKFPNKTALRYEFGSKKVYVLGKCEPYFNVFISGSAYRNCCYNCQYATSKRVGDITLGDYWGIKKFHPEFDNSNGVSLILINTEKGEKIASIANLDVIESRIEQAWAGNGILRAPSEKAMCRDYLYDDIRNMGYEKALKKNIKVKTIIYNIVLSHLPTFLIKALAKLK